MRVAISSSSPRMGTASMVRTPPTIASRSIILKMWPKKPDEKAEDFAYADDPEFSTIQRKLARWAADNVRIIKGPEAAAAARQSAERQLETAVANCAACWWWLARAGTSVCDLPSRAPYEPSVGVQLLAVLRAMFTKNRTEITSEQAVQELLADPDLPWHEYRGRGQSPKTRSPRCCETMIFVPSSFIRLSEPISRGTVTGQRYSRTSLNDSNYP